MYRAECVVHIAFNLLHMSHPVLAIPVWKLPWTVCWTQLSIWTVLVCPFSTSKSSSLSKTTQFTLGPSIENYKNFDSNNPEIDSRMHVKRLSAFGLSKNSESKYRVNTIFVVLLKDLMFMPFGIFAKQCLASHQMRVKTVGKNWFVQEFLPYNLEQSHIKSCNVP